MRQRVAAYGICCALIAGAGWGGASAAEAADRKVTSLRPARFVVTRQPAPRVVYGTPSRVTASLAIEGGIGVPGQDVQLLAKQRASKRWKTVASGTTDGNGNVTLRATLPGSSLLRLRHSGTVVAATDIAVRSVTVAKRVTAAVDRTHAREGRPLVVRGRVTPRQSAGSPLWLQGRSHGSWRRLAAGRMITRTRYVIRWTPARHGNFRLRVKAPRDRARAAGRSGEWRQRVDRETAAAIALDILRNDRIELERMHPSSGSYLGSAHQNIIDVANGRRARHSCHGGAPCGTSTIDVRVLRAVRDMGRRGTLTVSEFVGGVHMSGSAHYSGQAVDINWVDGRHVGPGANYERIVKRCRAHGAKKIYTPSHDPYGGHNNHVHCGWK